MGETKTENAQKTSWFTGLKAEFDKIIWPSKSSLGKQTVAVVAVSIVLGIIIAVIDAIFKYGIDGIVGL